MPFEQRTLETVKGAVQRVVFHSEETGFKVLKVRMNSGPILSVTGELGPDIVVGTVAIFHGDHRTHPKYGSSFRVASYEIEHNAEELNSIKLYIDAIAPNVGRERSEMLIAHFGDDLIRIMDKEPHRLSEAPGIGKVTAESLVAAWRINRDRWSEVRQEFTLRAFLYALGIKERRVKRILGHFGGGLLAETQIKDNPYILAEVDGIGFSLADHVAQKIGVPLNSPARLRAFIFYVFNHICPSNGHLFLTEEELVQIINQYGSEQSTVFIDKPKLDRSDVTELINLLVLDEKLTRYEDGVYSNKCHFYESRAAELLTEIVEKPSDLLLLNQEAVDHFIINYEEENGIILSDDQRRAMHYFVEKKVFIITGGPGTGKTSILKAIVEFIKKSRLQFICLTPTGISAKKLSLTVKHEASTIHRSLGFRGNEWIHGENNKVETDVVITDEASMIDQEVFYRLLSALKNRVHLILVGDDNQLPSVGAGNVLRELINCGVIPTVRLNVIFRQAEASDIIRVAHRIKEGDTDLSNFKTDPKSDVFFIRENNVQVIETTIVRFAQKFKDERRLFQIISPKNQGPLSVSALNKLLQDVLNPASPVLEEMAFDDGVIRKGDRIIIKKNDYENLIYNGDIGKIVKIGGGFVTVIIDDREIQLSLDDLDGKMKLAYVISAHASQGQEYPYIILPFINQYGKFLLQRNLLYTALTRAKQKAIILGHGSALERAILNSSVYKRNTKLGVRVCQILENRRKLFTSPLPEMPPECPPVQPNAVPVSSAPIEELPSDTIEMPVKKKRRRSSKPSPSPEVNAEMLPF